MRIRKRTVSETETHRLVTVRGRAVFAWCRGCSREVETVAVDCAEEVPGVGTPSLRQRIESSGHFAVTEGDKVLVCHRWLRHPD